MTFHLYLQILYSLCLLLGTIGVCVSILTNPGHVGFDSAHSKKFILAIILLIVGFIGLFIDTLNSKDTKETANRARYAYVNYGHVSYPNHYNSPVIWRVKSNGHWGYERW